MSTEATTTPNPKITGLTELLENLKEEINGWDFSSQPHTELATAPTDAPPAQPTAEENALIRHGLYLTAMDILLAEMRRPGGYESYSLLPDRILLPLDDYAPLRKALDPYVSWFRNLLFQHATQLAQSGTSDHDAFRQAVVTGTDQLEHLTAG